MSKRLLGNALTTLGSPAWLGIVGTMNCFTASGKASDLLWTVPLTIVSLPLLPLYMKGESLLRECDVKDFEERTRSLPHVHSPKDPLHIHEFEGKFYIEPVFDEGPFDTLQDARLFLGSLGYQEVVDDDNPNQHLWGTYWIKNDESQTSNR